MTGAQHNKKLFEQDAFPQTSNIPSSRVTTIYLIPPSLLYFIRPLGTKSGQAPVMIRLILPFPGRIMIMNGGYRANDSDTSSCETPTAVKFDDFVSQK